MYEDDTPKTTERAMNAVPSKESPTAEALGIQGSRINELDEAIRILIDKLQPVFGPQNDTPSSTAAPNVPSSDLVNVLNQHNEKLEELIYVVHNARKRVEL